MSAGAASVPGPAPADTAGQAILERARAAFDDRLDPLSDAPIAVGFSGGSDSLALLLAARAWADGCGRRLLVLTVDHGLNPASAAWTEAAGRLAARLGLEFQALAWAGPKPLSSIAAFARAARHRLLADAARAAGARVLLLGHTADDVAEAARMRLEGASVPSPRTWSPSPAWPEGRGVFLLRPLLGLRRAALRGLLAPSGLGWIEDPANDNPAFARARARRGLRLEPAPAAVPEDPPARFEAMATVDDWGVVRIARPAIAAFAEDEARRLIALACVCAGGGDRLPRTARVQALLGRIRAGEAFVATLSGARVEGGGDVVVCRDAGRIEGAGRACGPRDRLVWDGRFEVVPVPPGAELRPLRGLASRLSADERRRLAMAPAAVRAGLPAFHFDNGRVSCPLLAEQPAADVRCLVRGRFAAAAGLLPTETECARRPDGGGGLGALS